MGPESFQLDEPLPCPLHHLLQPEVPNKLIFGTHECTSIYWEPTCASPGSWMSSTSPGTAANSTCTDWAASADMSSAMSCSAESCSAESWSTLMGKGCIQLYIIIGPGYVVMTSTIILQIGCIKAWHVAYNVLQGLHFLRPAT